MARVSDPVENGVIRSGESYALEEFKRRVGLSTWALRKARSHGLVVRYRHGRAFVLGSDWLDYLASTPRG